MVVTNIMGQLAGQRMAVAQQLLRQNFAAREAEKQRKQQNTMFAVAQLENLGQQMQQLGQFKQRMAEQKAQFEQTKELEESKLDWEFRKAEAETSRRNQEREYNDWMKIMSSGTMSAEKAREALQGVALPQGTKDAMVAVASGAYEDRQFQRKEQAQTLEAGAENIKGARAETKRILDYLEGKSPGAKVELARAGLIDQQALTEPEQRKLVQKRVEAAEQELQRLEQENYRLTPEQAAMLQMPEGTVLPATKVADLMMQLSGLQMRKEQFEREMVMEGAKIMNARNIAEDDRKALMKRHNDTMEQRRKSLEADIEAAASKLRADATKQASTTTRSYYEKLIDSYDEQIAALSSAPFGDPAGQIEELRKKQAEAYKGLWASGAGGIAAPGGVQDPTGADIAASRQRVLGGK